MDVTKSFDRRLEESMEVIKSITTNQMQGKYWLEEVKQAEETKDCMHVINVYPDLVEQEIEGFGGAFTEASVHNYENLSEEGKLDFLAAYFKEEGLRYNMGRVHMNSCDFALKNYTYVNEGDMTLDSFDIYRDEKSMIPLLKQAMQEQEIHLLVSPWSPPAYMKTNGEMNHGGKLKEKCYGLWAEYFVKYIKAYQKAGIDIKYVTIQNEPEAVQTWDSCIYSAKEEGVFVRDYLAPAFKKSGLTNVGIFIWDHNKEAVYERVTNSFFVEGVRELVSGVAVHWYTGDHFDGIRAVKKSYQEMKVFFTEGCVEYSRFAESGEVEKAEMYAHDMLGNLKAGIEAFIDWNLLLDENGGPNHVGNFCAAPIMCNGIGGIEKRLSYYYIGHFSRHIKRGANQIMTSSYTDKIETVAFVNPDGERVLVVLNKSEHDVPVTIREFGYGIEVKIEKHSICTYLWK